MCLYYIFDHVVIVVKRLAALEVIPLIYRSSNEFKCGQALELKNVAVNDC